MSLTKSPDDHFSYSISQIQLTHAERIINSRKHVPLSIVVKQIDPQSRIQLSTSKLFRGNAATSPDILRRNAVATLAAQPVPQSTVHIKLDYTIDYYSCNSTEKKDFF
jgi:hypothetical protein